MRATKVFILKFDYESFSCCWGRSYNWVYSTHRMVFALDGGAADAIVAVAQNLDSQLLVFLFVIREEMLSLKKE